MKKLAILGSTGSVGKNTLSIVEKFSHLFQIKALAARSNIDLLEIQASKFNPDIIAVFEEDRAKILQKRLPNVKVVSKMEGLIEVASFHKVDFVVLAIVGSIGMVPTIAAIDAGKDIGLANKEVLVCGGELIKERVLKKGVRLIPIDSEHSAIFQCLQGEDSNSVTRLVLTASGGPFHKFSCAELDEITIEQALVHPTYRMGGKISVDSSTLMNKGLEVIEARWLFNIPSTKIEVVIHPQSIIHSMVEFIDGSMLAQMSEPDMRVPIQYALTYPERIRSQIMFDFSRERELTFFPPDMEKFLALKLAYWALEEGKSMPCYMNGANEVLVRRFLHGEISWRDIACKLEKLMSSHIAQDMVNLESILNIDEQAKKDARGI